jgi:L,D-transpeptidase catalytic domain/Bacterial Ig-like domain
VLSVGRRGKQAATQDASSGRVSNGRVRASLSSASAAFRDGWVRASLGSAGTALKDGGVRALFDGAKRRAKTRKRAIAAVTAVVAVVAGGGVYLLTQGGGTPPNAPITYGAVTLPGPFRVMSVTPAPGSQHADGSQPVRVTFSAPPAARSPMPTVTPDVPGSWQIVGDAAVFTPTTPFRPSTKITVSIPADVRSNAGHVLAGPKTAQYTTGTYATLRLAEILGQLGYLPWSWQLPNVGLQTQSEANSGTASAASSSLAGQLALAYDPPTGIFTMEQGYPASLASLWQPDRWNVVLRGAVMAFQSEHNMSVDGTVTPALWSALFRAVMNGQNNVNGYTYAAVSQVDPETLTIYHDGQVVLRSLTNTGIPASPTVNGTFPVYEKFLETYMSGTNPGGSTYHDLVQYVSYFNGGDAVHYFVRPGYGYQQSLGCVELPFTQAKEAYPYLTLGSLVNVSG